MMKSKSLSFQVWMWFTGLIVGICIILSLIFYISLENFLKEQIYTYIEEQQNEEMITTEKPVVEIKDVEKVEAIKSIPTIPSVKNEVIHAYVDKGKYSDIKAKDLSPMLKVKIAYQAESQETEKKRYEKVVGNEKLLYVISKQQVGNQSVYVYSYVWQNLKKTILAQFWYVFFIILVVILVMLIPAHIISNRITKPLVMLERDMERIAKRDWEQPIKVEGSEEVENLSKSCEWMRKQLINHDLKQQSTLQSISHELKTPIMVIRSYIQAIKDGFYPKGSLDATIDIIDEEANRLQKKALDLIYITNLEYMAHNKRLEEDVELKGIIQEVYGRLQYKRVDVNWKLDIQDTVIKGDPEQWKVVFENILQNQLRYSKDQIEILIKKQNEKVVCRIYNNGICIEENQKDKFFNAFEKGIRGESGLGLTIVKRIVDMYEGKVWVENENSGVAFYISIPVVL